MSVFVWIPLTLGLCLLATELIRRSPFWVSLLVFAVLPVALAAAWPSLGLGPTGFEYVKVFSVAFGSLFISALRFLPGWIGRSGLRWVAFFILFVNILEAMVTETFSSTYINAAAGGLLLLSQALPRLMQVDEAGPHRDLRYDLGWDWVIGYTLWNFTFVYGTNPPGEPTGEWAAFALIHLSVPLFLMAGNAEKYIQYRAYSLTLMMMVGVTFPYEPYLYLVGEWHNATVAQTLRIVSFAWAAFVLVRSFRNFQNEPRGLAALVASKLAGH